MITKDELKDYANLKGLTLGNAEKDYLLEIALLLIARNTKDELVFKGGTALYKFYKLDRFSEDLDFSTKKSVDIDSLLKNIIKGLIRFGIDSRIHGKKTTKDTVMATIRTKGPLYTGRSITYSKIEIDINQKSSVIMQPRIKKLVSIYPEIPTFNLLVMDVREIFAEKIRAVMTRDKARDVYDIWFLQKNIKDLDKESINKKLKYYDKKFDFKKFTESIDNKKANWKKDLKPLLRIFPKHEKIKKEITKFIKKHL
ncbi:hypothetical protein GF327_07945 [Candidatus Woesearchaeota archaeon]|nr:hypothetical protein [Candidatus Woesearchaeota archaeon]